MSSLDLKHQRDTLWRDLARITALARQTPFDTEAFGHALTQLYEVDRFWTFPGREILFRLSHYLRTAQFALIEQLVQNCCQRLLSGQYRLQTFAPFQTHLEQLDRPILHDEMQLASTPVTPAKPYFEVLIIHPLPDQYDLIYRQQLAAFKSPQDEFIYDIVFVNNAQDALTAVLANPDLQACVYLHHVPEQTPASSATYQRYSQALIANTPPASQHHSVEVNLCRSIRCLRPELSHILISEFSPAQTPCETRQAFDRVLFHEHPFHDLHTEILSGIRKRYATPFFDALQAYSRQPKGVFHALPLSRGASVKGSPWVQDMLDFYGHNIFLAETSSTQGGMDSLLDPKGAIKQAHMKAAQAFGADHTYFVTNGTSTSNKIVMQANLRPGDIVLISADCHKSIPYSVMLTGAYPIFLETYPLPEHDLYGGIELEQIKAAMLDLKAQNRLDRLKQITLTNSTFDGLIYQCEDFMMEILAIKPDIIFHWDEAWSAFAHCHPLYFSRTAMSAVLKIRQRMQSPHYQTFYEDWKARFDADPDPRKWLRPLYPDPQQVCLRVYATQSTHKTLTSFRQGSMIHVADARFHQDAFLEAFRIHTSTSPNYQIIASLDIARRQASLEGFHRVRDAIVLALQLRQRIRQSPLLQPYFSVLGDEEFTRSAATPHPPSSLPELAEQWGRSAFVVDPTRITLNIAKTGLDGCGFRQLLMTRYDIQVNKTSRHTVLFIINIGITQSTIDYLMQVLSEIATLFQRNPEEASHSAAIPTLPLPGKRRFHPAFLPFEPGPHPASDLRSAYFDGCDDSKVTHVPLTAETMGDVQRGRVLVSAAFVTPYPPGFPVIVPGQIITEEILNFFLHIKVKEIHGFSAQLGFKVFLPSHLATLSPPSARLIES